FFVQAEDGIRDRNVTGVQTCALPISGDRRRWVNPIRSKIRQTTLEAARRVVGWIARGRWQHRSQTDDRQARRVTDSSTEPGVSVACPLSPGRSGAADLGDADGLGDFTDL